MTTNEIKAAARIFATCYKATGSRSQQDITNAQMFPLRGATLAVKKLQQMHKGTPEVEKKIAEDFALISLETMQNEFARCLTMEEQSAWMLEYMLSASGEKSTKTERIYIRLTPEMKAKMQAAAEAENRTISNYVERLVEKDIEEKESQK